MRTHRGGLGVVVLLVLVTSGNGVRRAQAQFTSNNTSLYNWLDLTELGGADNGNDCWGYVSPSGREYALMAISNKVVVVEITNPGSPVVVGNIPHTNSLWCDLETYGNNCYAINESGGGLDVIELANVDNGMVSLITHAMPNGFTDGHTLSINTQSGFLYINGSSQGGGRLAAYSLANPDNPTFAGQVGDAGSVYTHDSQVVSYTSGPYAGSEIAFCCNGSTGLDVYDVTNKANMFRMSRTVYPNLAYCHQGSLDGTRTYYYINDELDGMNETVIMNVANLSSPFVAGSYNSGVSATDHNLQWKDGFIFEAEYHAGLRIFCAADPLNPVQVGWFDSFPTDNASGYDGSWSVYPFFPSGAVLIANMYPPYGGLFIVNPSAALAAGALTFDYPAGQPQVVAPQGGTALLVQLDSACGAVVQPGTATLHYDDGGGFQNVAMSKVSDNLYEGVFGATSCPATVSYYVSAENLAGQTITDPAGAPADTYSAVAASGQDVVLFDNFESDLGWTTENLGATAGFWQRGVPINDPNWAFDPATDGDGSGQCWLTENLNNPAYPDPSNTDVDGGAVRLTSPVLDMTAGNVSISYEYYLLLTIEDGTDQMLVEISSNGSAGPWTAIAVHNTTGGTNWRHHEIAPDDLDAAGVALTANMKVRFTANDFGVAGGGASIVEAGVDGFQISSYLCKAPCPQDLNGSGAVDASDLALLLGAWGPNPDHPADFNGDGVVNASDLALLLGAWGPCD